MWTFLSNTLRVVNGVGFAMLAARAYVQMKYEWDKKHNPKPVPLPIEDQLDIAIHTQQIEEAQS